MKQKTARFKVEGQDIIYDNENSDTGFVANTMGLYYIEITFSNDWADCDKIYLLLNNGKYKEKMLMTKVSGTTYRNLINNVFVSTSALTLGCVGYKTSDPSLRYITDPDSRNLTFIQSVDLNEETLNQTQITELETLRLKVDKLEQVSGASASYDDTEIKNELSSLKQEVNKLEQSGTTAGDGTIEINDDGSVSIVFK